MTMPEPEAMAQNVANPAALLQHFDGDGDLVQELVELFLEDCPTRLSAVRDAVERHDGPAVAREAHGIKGSVANFAAYPAVAAAQRLELLGRSENWTEVDDALGILAMEVARLMKMLHSFAECLAEHEDAHAES